MMYFRLLVAFCFFVALGGCTNFQPNEISAKHSITATAPGFSEPADLQVKLSDTSVGVSADHAASARLGTDDLQVHLAQLIYPTAFTMNGFLALGGSGAQVGMYAMDVDLDGTFDLIAPVRSSGDFTGFVDMNNNGTEDASDFGVYYSLGIGGRAAVHGFELLMPFGGDGNAAQMTGFYNMDVVLQLNQGVMNNPTAAGTYAIRAALTSVDPDTGGASDNRGSAPLTLSITQYINIGGSATYSVPVFGPWGMIFLFVGLMLGARRFLR